MSNIEKIRQEIESKMRETDDSQFGIGGRCMCRIILAFIDTLPEEKPLTVEDIKTILDISFWNNDPEKILQEYNRLKK